MGGLEPPTSASQTQRAANCATPRRDESIIGKMKASQGWRPRWFSHLTRAVVLCCGVVVLLNACILQPSQAILTTISSPPTATTKPTGSLPPTSTPKPTLTATLTPTFEQGCVKTEGQLIAGEFESELLAKTFNFQVYLPACYGTDPELRYPVVYLLHGLYTDETQWDLVGLANAADIFVKENKIPFIVVMPRVPDNDAQSKSPIHQVIPDELVTYIDRNYPTITDREHRAIGGLSRGLHWRCVSAVTAVICLAKWACIVCQCSKRNLPLTPNSWASSRIRNDRCYFWTAVTTIAIWRWHVPLTSS